MSFRRRYNLLPDNYGKCKRRIDVSAISGVTVSKVSDEFVVHVAEEYDYHFESVSDRSLRFAMRVNTDLAYAVSGFGAVRPYRKKRSEWPKC
jgi:hypothetical protein